MFSWSKVRLRINIPCLGLTSIAVLLLLANALKTDIDKSRYDEGRKQFELVEQKSQMPKYGQCWRDAMIVIQSGCRRLDDVVQTHLALSYLNCFLQIQGRSVYPCSQESDLVTCVQGMNDADRGSFATFFAHTQDICYFLQAQIWQEHTDNTISRLEESSSQVAEQLEYSHQLQQDMASIQNISLHNQGILMSHAQNLSDIINVSSKTVHSLFQDLKKSTREQQQIIGGLSDQLSKLQSAIFGEISGFYSLFYYVLSVFISYLLTSASRTSGARFWLFLLMTANIILEQTMVRWIATSYILGDDDIGQEHQYWLQKQCRRACLVLAVFILAVCTYMYQDVNAVNNRLLVEIRRQNSDLWRLFTDNLKTFIGPKENLAHETRQAEAESTDSDYTSDNNNDDSDGDSDKTFILPENYEYTDTDSMRTLHDDDMSGTDRLSLHEELDDLRKVTLETQNNSHDIESWLNRSFSELVSSSTGNEEIESAKTPASGNTPYNLRPRRSGPGHNTSPAAQVESSKSFSRTVHQMQQITEKNSRLFRAIQQYSGRSDAVADNSHATPSGSRL